MPSLRSASVVPAPTLGSKTELQAVVLAGGVGTRMRELTKGRPKCLLPVGNRPILFYPLHSLVLASFTGASLPCAPLAQLASFCPVADVLVIVPDAHQQEIAEEVRVMGLELRVEYFSIPIDKHLGTAESLAMAKERLTSDLIILSCDVVTDYPLVKLITMHRDQDAAMIALISTQNPTATTRAYGSSKNRSEKDLIGVDGDRLVFFNSEFDFGQSIPFSASLLNRCSDMHIFSNFFDSHVYIFKKPAVDAMIREGVIKSLKGEFLPHLVGQQFGEDHVKEDEQEPVSDTIERALARLEPSCGDRRGLMLQRITDGKYPNGRTRCFLQVIRSGYCVRGNSLAGYIEANKAIASRESDQRKGRNFVNSILGKDSVCADSSHLVRSVVGANCRIKSNVKISDSVIMDGVTIEEGCVVQASVICADAKVGKKCSLERCLVSGGYQVHQQSQFANEFLADGGEVDMFEF